MFNLHITLLMAFDMLTNIAKREPARVGSREGGGCVYATENNGVLSAVCIVGQMFADLGILRVLTAPMPGEDENGDGITFNPVNAAESPVEGAVCNLSGIGPHLRKRIAVFGITFDDNAFEFMGLVQSNQDTGAEWGAAVESAAQEALDRGLIPTPTDPRTAVEQASQGIESLYV